MYERDVNEIKKLLSKSIDENNDNEKDDNVKDDFLQLIGITEYKDDSYEEKYRYFGSYYWGIINPAVIISGNSEADLHLVLNKEIDFNNYTSISLIPRLITGPDCIKFTPNQLNYDIGTDDIPDKFTFHIQNKAGVEGDSIYLITMTLLKDTYPSNPSVYYEDCINFMIITHFKQ